MGRSLAKEEQDYYRVYRDYYRVSQYINNKRAARVEPLPRTTEDHADKTKPIPAGLTRNLAKPIAAIPERPAPPNNNDF